jgi:hypothetical protein
LYVGGNLIVSNVSYEYQEIITTTELVKGNLVAAAGTASTSTNTGALVVVGGAGVEGNLYITNTGDVSANIGRLHNANIAINANLGAFQTFVIGNLTIRDNNIIDLSANLGTIYLGNISTQANLGTIYLGNISTQANLGTIYLGNISTQANLGAFQIYANSKIGTNPNSNIVAISTDPSTSIDTGAIVTRGGVGIAGNLNVGEAITASGNINANSGALSDGVTTGALTVNGGAGITGRLYIGDGIFSYGNVTISSTVASDSPTTGALVVQGGVGIAGNLTVGSRVHSDLIPAIDDTYDLGAPLFRWRDLNLSGDAAIAGETSIGGDLYVTGVSTSDSVATNYIDVAGTVSATYLSGTLTTAVQTNITLDKS